MGTHSIEVRQRIAESSRLRWQDPDYRERVSKKISEGKKGKQFTEEHKQHLRDAKVGYKPSPEHMEMLRKLATGREFSSESRRKMSIAAMNRSGPKTSNWQGGISFEPYCDKFNLRLKESIRNKYGRVCVSCGKSEIFNGRRLSVHHIDLDKQQGCNGNEWKLVPLCDSCHAKIHVGTLVMI